MVRFDRRTTILHEPGLARSVLLDREQRFTVQHNFLQQPLTADDLRHTWGTRRAVNRLLRPEAVRGLSSLVAAAVRDAWGDLDTRGLAVDPVPRLERVTSSVLSQYYFGGEGSELPEAVGDLLDALGRIIGNPFALPPNRLSPARRQVARRHARLLEIVRPLVAERVNRPGGHSDLVTQILAEAPGVPTARLAHWILASLLAGHRVPAAAAAWVLMMVAERPGLQTELQAEATQFSSGLSSGSHGSSIDYPLASSVVLETLRLYPPTWLLVRTAAEPVQLGGYRFDSGHQFLVSPYVLHRDPDEWPNAGEFLPERWLERPRPQGVFVPFGLGMHACPGRDPALLMIVATLLRVVGEWTLARSDTVVRADPRTALLPSGLRISFSPRAPDRVVPQPLAG